MFWGGVFFKHEANFRIRPRKFLSRIFNTSARSVLDKNWTYASILVLFEKNSLLGGDTAARRDLENVYRGKRGSRGNDDL